MREVIITEILYDFDQKNWFFEGFFEGFSCFKFNYLKLVLGMALKFYRCVEERLKLKVKSIEGN